MIKLNCSQITERLKAIRHKQEDFEEARTGEAIPEALKIQAELSALIEKSRQEIGFVFLIEGKEFSVESLVIDSKTREELEQEIKGMGLRSTNFALYMLDKMFNDKEYIERNRQRLNKPEKVNLVRLKVSDLGFPHGGKTNEVFRRAFELGLKLCPPEVSLHHHIKHKGQPSRIHNLAMEPIMDPNGKPRIFSMGYEMKSIIGPDGKTDMSDLTPENSDPWVDGFTFEPDYPWFPDFELIFCLPQVVSKKD